jgi:cell division protein FtsI (penicillin-binding protein 3)
MALPEPTHTEIEENTLLVPAERDPTLARTKPATSAAKLQEKAKSATAKTPAKAPAKPKPTPSKTDQTAPAERNQQKPASPKKTMPPSDIRSAQRGTAKPEAVKTGRNPKSA